MKKKIVLTLMSLVTLAVILVGCGNNQASAANEKEDSTLLKPGTVWKDDNSTLKVIDDSTWEYTKDSPMPVSKQISVERIEDYTGFETYKIIDSADVKEFTSSTHEFFVIPIEENGITQISFGAVPSKENEGGRTHDEVIEFSRKYGDNYKLQK
ncbi:hypothetical protein GUI51_13610 [Enterococcus mundtii]|uniref:Uncharacterized protein n=1 Tax=Enterococcus mundtii TaxID=53346 RepID=A0ABQ0VFM8_ENTMU|nr:hypothetical protein [Enterococcus mundtii]MZU11466.1 hypothetical protein [Bifidobacterium longum]GEN18555.1 hypothetical protein LAC02_18360 [Ligilactobacillus acidipiscis]AUB54498.1 hypothetical protein EM4838_15915 [Enterococcus mundtii]MZZ60038.1 hypothetical protein [Enterococcus mundtii]MZZ63042.1 hypothetical protein [Enterococcus mundtii]